MVWILENVEFTPGAAVDDKEPRVAFDVIGTVLVLDETETTLALDVAELLLQEPPLV